MHGLSTDYLTKTRPLSVKTQQFFSAQEAVCARYFKKKTRSLADTQVQAQKIIIVAAGKGVNFEAPAPARPASQPKGAQSERRKAHTRGSEKASQGIEPLILNSSVRQT